MAPSKELEVVEERALLQMASSPTVPIHLYLLFPIVEKAPDLLRTQAQ